MTSDKTGINHLVAILVRKGIDSVVISPGSRNAPLAISFAREPAITCYHIVDERSAAFFALGMARQMQKPIVLVSTSGSAVLNYAPAIAEAYYQEVPLICLTADRQAAWIDQGESQTIRQFQVFQNFVLGSFELPEVIQNNDDLWLNNRVVNEALNLANGSPKGPVHINIPLAEPLYGQHAIEAINPKIIHHIKPEASLSALAIRELRKEWNQYSKKLLLTGKLHPDSELQSLLASLAQDQSLSVFTESTSNLQHELFFSCVDKLMVSISPEEMEELQPQLLISIGNQVISKMVKSWLRKIPNLEHWHIDSSGKSLDTYQHLTKVYPIEAKTFLNYLLPLSEHKSYTYRSSWEHVANRVSRAHGSYFDKLPFSDLLVFKHLTENLPESAQLDLANSTPIRYVQLFPLNSSISYFANRGTSGIDGSVSTAAGAAFVSDRLHLLITGDLSFFYDSNGLWHAYHKPNFKIIVINNSGGNIFRFIDGPSQLPELEEFFEVRHNYSAEHIAKAFHFNFVSVKSEQELVEALPSFFELKDHPEIMEIQTPPEQSGIILKQYFLHLKNFEL